MNGVLIDAGISATAIRNYLKNLDIPMNAVKGVLITHNHIDHIRGLELLTRKYGIRAFTTRKIRDSMPSSQLRITPDSFIEIPLQKKFQIAGFEIEAFTVSHDAPETLGFCISAGEKIISIITDLGYINETAAQYCKAANLLVIESNYDEQLLQNGKYPHYIKARIQSDHGHLGNHQTSAFLADNINDNLCHICLAHLSINNNTPELAIQTILQTFAERGIVLNREQRISVLNRDFPSEIISLI